MAGYHAFRKLRLHLWVGFVVTLLFAISSKDLDPSLWDYTRYLPVTFLLLALGAGVVEKKLREHLGA
jgi:hypothetical protein